MIEKTITTINTIDDFYLFVREHWDSHYIYRGESKKSYQLISKYGRCIKNNKKNKNVEQKYFGEFKQHAIPYINYDITNDLDWLSLAQHHGLNTRLLDWTRNPLVALYFAVIHNRSKDSVIYVLRETGFPTISSQTDPFSIKSDYIYLPKHLSNRITAQSGVFTLHHKPEEIFNSASLERIIIKSDNQYDMLLVLQTYNINAHSMFPDMTGLSDKLTDEIIWTKDMI